MNATFGADVKNLNGTKDVFVSSATFEDASGAANFNTTELNKYNLLVNKAEGSLKQASVFLNEIKEYGQSKFMMNAMFKTFMNRFIRSGIPIKDAQSTSDLFVGFYSL